MADQRPITRLNELSAKTDLADDDLVLTYDDALNTEQKITWGVLKQQIGEKAIVSSASGANQPLAGALDDRVVRVGSVAGLRALITTELGDNAGARITATGRAGDFYWDSSDLSAEVTSDPQSGIYVAPDSDATGASGAWVRDVEGPILAEWFGLTGTGDSQAIIAAAIAQANSNPVEYSQGFELSTTLDISRYQSLVGVSASSWPQFGITWTGTSGVAVQTDANQTHEGITLDGVSKPAGSIGLQMGRDTNYEAYTTIKRAWLKGWDVGCRLSNVFDNVLDRVRISGNRVGIHMDPVDFTIDGGYTTTVSLRQVYVTDNDEEGFLDTSPVQAKMLFIGNNSVFEKNGGALHPQVKIKAAQVANLDTLYIEDGENSATGVEMVTGRLANAYINGSDYGVDFGSGPCYATLENIKFAGGASASVRATGGAIATRLTMRHVDFSVTPDISANSVLYDGCKGTMPSGIPENSWVLTGTTPQWGVGSTPAITRDLEAHISEQTSFTAIANTTTKRNVIIPNSRLSAGLTALSATPQSGLPAGVTLTIERQDDSTARLVYANLTGANIAVPATDILVRVERYSALT